MARDLKTGTVRRPGNPIMSRHVGQWSVEDAHQKVQLGVDHFQRLSLSRVKLLIYLTSTTLGSPQKRNLFFPRRV